MKNSMTVSSNGPSAGQCEWAAPERPRRAAMRRAGPRDVESLRRCAWEIGERRAAEGYAPQVNHVGLAMVNPTQGFIHWHMLPEWVEQARERSRDSWHHCRMVVRLYDVSYIHFTGLNAHRIQDHPLPALCGQLFFPVPGARRPGNWRRWASCSATASSSPRRGRRSRSSHATRPPRTATTPPCWWTTSGTWRRSATSGTRRSSLRSGTRRGCARPCGSGPSRSSRWPRVRIPGWPGSSPNWPPPSAPSATRSTCSSPPPASSPRT